MHPSTENLCNKLDEIKSLLLLQNKNISARLESIETKFNDIQTKLTYGERVYLDKKTNDVELSHASLSEELKLVELADTVNLSLSQEHTKGCDSIFTGEYSLSNSHSSESKLAKEIEKQITDVKYKSSGKIIPAITPAATDLLKLLFENDKNLIQSCRVIKELGVGGEGVVFLGLISNIPFAFKMLMNFYKHNKEALEKSFETEWTILDKLHSKYIMKPVARFVATPTTEMMNIFHPSIREFLERQILLSGKLESLPVETQFFIFEYHPMDLETKLKQLRSTKQLNWETILKYSLELLEALEYLFEMKVVHNDIKLDNILVSSEDSLVLGDFGCSFIAINHVGVRHQLEKGNRASKAPEIHNGLHCGKKAIDVSKQYSWEAGCMLFEIAFGVVPFVSKKGEYYPLGFNDPHTREIKVPKLQYPWEEDNQKHDKEESYFARVVSLLLKNDEKDRIHIKEARLMVEEIVSHFSPSQVSNFQTEENSLRNYNPTDLLKLLFENYSSVMKICNVVGSLGQGGEGVVFMISISTLQLALKMITNFHQHNKEVLELSFETEWTILNILHSKYIMKPVVTFVATPTAEMMNIFDPDIREFLERQILVSGKLESLPVETQFFIFECHPMDLETKLKQLRSTKQLNWETILKYSLELLKALEYLFEMKVVHNDIKLNNVLVSSEDSLVLGDFECSFIAPNESCPQ